MTVIQSPGLALVKSASPTTVTAAGDKVSYSFVVTNSGNVTVGGVGIVETAFSGSGTLGAVSCPQSSLPPGGSETCSAVYHATQADLDAGSITNTAHATATAPGAPPVASADSSASVTASQSGGLSLVKSAVPGGASTYRAGRVITYHYLVTNIGNVTVSGVGIAEGTFTGSGSLSAISCPVTTLAPGGQVDCMSSYTLTQADVDGGSISNTATVTGTGPTGPVSSAPSTPATPATPNPVLTLSKTVSPTTVNAAGDSVTYSYLVTNAGNVSISGVGIDETAFSGTGTALLPSCPLASLLPGQHETCTASYSLTQADIDAGSVTNTATATGTDPSGGTVVATASHATVNVKSAAALVLAKTVSPTVVTHAGQMVTYQFAVTNIGNMTVRDLYTHDSEFGGSGSLSAVSCPSSSLAPKGSETCTATYVLTAHDMLGRSFGNTAVAQGTAGPSSNPEALASSASTAVLSVDAATPPPDGGKGESVGSGPIAVTGTDVLALGGTGVVLILAGIVAVLSGHRRRRA